MVASLLFSGSVRPAPPATDCDAAPSVSRQEARRDAELVRRFNAGDEGAFVEIVGHYRAKMFSVALSLLRNRADAEEIAQDTFIRAYRGLANFRGDSALATWLYQIALNLSRNRYWYLSRRCQHATRSFDSAFSDDNHATLASLVASDAPSPAQEAETVEFSELVAGCLEQLGPSRRDVLMQRNMLNRSYDEIARTLGISVGTVKSRIARARKNLRTELSRTCPEFALDSSPSEWLYPARSSGRLETVSA